VVDKETGDRSVVEMGERADENIDGQMGSSSLIWHGTTLLVMNVVGVGGGI
jgi:hypothetical protein